MNKYAYNYFTLSYKYIIKNSKTHFIFSFLELYINLIEFISYLTLMSESFDKNFIENFYLNNFSLIYYFRKYIQNNDFKYPIYSIVIILIIQILNIIYYYCDFLKKFDNLNKIVINFYDIFYFRIFSILTLDIIFNFILFYWNKKSKNILNSGFIILFLLLFFLFFVNILNNYVYNIIYIKIKGDNNDSYPFDFLTNIYYFLNIIFKIFLTFAHNIYITSSNKNLIYLILIILILLNWIQVFFFLFIFKKFPFLIINNFILHKFRFCFNIFISLWGISVNFKTYSIEIYYYIISLSFFLLSCTFFFYFNLDNFLKNKINNLDSKTNLFYILTLKNMNQINLLKIYIQNVNYHRSLCGNCDFCMNLENIINKQIKENFVITRTFTSKINNFSSFVSTYKKKNINFKETENLLLKENNEINQNENEMLNNFYKAFLKNFRKEIQSKSIKKLNESSNIFPDEIFYDFLSVFQYIFNFNGITYKLRFKISNLLKKYIKINNTVAFNIHLIYNELYEKDDKNNNNNNNDSNIIENIKIYVYFSNKLRLIINNIIHFILDNLKSPMKFLELGKSIYEILNKKNLQTLKSRQKSNDYCIDLISYSLEEITNIPLNNDKGFIKDTIFINGEIYNFNFINSKNIIIEFNPQKNVFKIIKTGNDLIKFVGMDFIYLFPHEFREEGKKKLIKSLKENKKIKNFDFLILDNKFEDEENNNNENIEKSSENNNENENKNNFIKFSNISNNDDKNVPQKHFDRIFIKFKLIFDNLENSENFYINGEYNYRFDEIIVTRKLYKSYSKIFVKNCNEKIGEEYLYNVSIKKINNITKRQKNKEKLKTFIGETNNLNEDKSNRNLIKLNNYFAKRNEREIVMSDMCFYRIFELKTKNYIYYVYGTEKNAEEIKKIQTKIDENNVYLEIDNDTFNNLNKDNLSLAMTFNSQSSIASHNNMQNDKKLLTIQEKKYKAYQNRFVNITKITFLFCIVMITFCIIALVVELKGNSKLLDSYSVYTDLRALNRLFYNTVTSILAVNCIGIPGEKGCVNYYELYNKNFYEKYGIDYPSFNYSIYENKIKVASYETKLIALKKQIYKLNDPKVNKDFNGEFNFTLMSLNNNKLITVNLTTTFVGALEILVNSFTILTSNETYETQPVYIITLKNSEHDYDFSNILEPIKIQNWQFEYYSLVINYQKYLNTWVTVQINCGENTNDRLRELSKIVIIFLCLFAFFHLLLFFLLYYYIFSFENLYIMSVNKIMNKLDNDNFTTFYINKYDCLSYLMKFFDKNPLILFKELDSFYNEYKRGNSPKKDSKEREKEEDEDIFDNKNKSLEVFSLNSYRIITFKFYVLIFFIIFYYLSLFIIFLTIWVMKVDMILNVFNIITDNTVCACSGYNMFALCQIMLLGNISEAEISKNMEYEGNNYIEFETIRSNNVIQTLSKRSDLVGGMIKNSNYFMDFNCDSFYSDINDGNFNKVNEKYPLQGFKEKYPEFCKYFQILKYNSDYLFYKPVYYEILKYLFFMKDNSYEFYIDFLINGNLFFMCDLQFLLYRPFRSWYNDVIYGDAINASINLEKVLLFTNLGLTIASEVIIFIIIYFFLFARLRHINGILTAVKNVFKII